MTGDKHKSINKLIRWIEASGDGQYFINHIPSLIPNMKKENRRWRRRNSKNEIRLEVFTIEREE